MANYNIIGNSKVFSDILVLYKSITRITLIQLFKTFTVVYPEVLISTNSKILHIQYPNANDYKSPFLLLLDSTVQKNMLLFPRF